LLESLVGAVEPLSALHLLEGLRKLVGIMLNDGLYIPDLGTLGIGAVAEEDVELHLAVLVLEDVVPVALDGGQELEPALR
jgi:hypothetical protein